jgi:hypothetical protein
VTCAVTRNDRKDVADREGVADRADVADWEQVTDREGIADREDAVDIQVLKIEKYYQSTSLSCSPTKPTVEGENLIRDDGPQLRTT